MKAFSRSSRASMRSSAAPRRSAAEMTPCRVCPCRFDGRQCRQRLQNSPLKNAATARQFSSVPYGVFVCLFYSSAYATLTLAAYPDDIWYTVPLARYFLNSLIVSTSASLLSVAVGHLRRLRGEAAMASGASGSSPPHRGAGDPDVPRGSCSALPLFLDLRDHREHDRAPALRFTPRPDHHLPPRSRCRSPSGCWPLLRVGAAGAGRGRDGRRLRAGARRSYPGGPPGRAARIIAVTIYAFMTAWGEVLFASVMTDDPDPDAGPVGLS